MPRQSIEICHDTTATNKYCWFTREVVNGQDDDNLLEIEGDYLTHEDDLLAALDARSPKYATYHVELCIGDGAGRELR